MRDEATFACNESAAPSPKAWRRLTSRQHENTVRDLITAVLPNQAAMVARELEPVFRLLPPDERVSSVLDEHGTFRRLDQEVQQSHVDAAYEVARRVAGALTEPLRLGALLGTCGTDVDTRNDAACVRDFVERFASRALRRPVTNADLDFYLQAYGMPAKIDRAALADVLTVVMSGPRFFYHVESGASPAGQPGLFRLDRYELAARLSYHFWDTLPDEPLLQSAHSGALDDQDEYERQVQRLAADPRARPAMTAFFREWLKLEDLQQLDAFKDDELYKAFAGEDLPTPSLRQEMIDDTLELIEHTLANASPFSGLLTTEAAFPRSPALAKLYQLPAWDDKSEPPRFAKGQRPGLLTRAAFLANASPRTRPIMRGLAIRVNILCDEIPPPPADAAAKKPEELRPDLSTREATSALTESGTCAGCHATLINPLGFALEGFDSLGRARMHERVFAADGSIIATRPVDVRSRPHVTTTDETQANGPQDLVKLIVASGKAEACFARHFVRFALARWEEPEAADGCALERLRQNLTKGQPMRDALRNFVLDPAFQERWIR